jgi:hypothetical protein
LTGAFDFIGQTALVFGTIPGNAGRLYLAYIGDILPDDVNVLVINYQFCIRAKLAVLLLSEFFPFIV